MLEAKIFNLAVTDKGFAIIMKPLASDKVIPIFIAPLEAQSIMTGVLGFNQPRPLTHDLIKSILDISSAKVLHILIDNLEGDTYHAKIAIEINDKTFLIDARPSDAIALSLRVKASIFIEEHLMDKAGFVLEGNENSGVEIKDSIPFAYQVFNKEPDLLKRKTENSSDDDSTFDEDSEISNEQKIRDTERLLYRSISEERYEDAARYRDELNNLRKTDLL